MCRVNSKLHYLSKLHSRKTGYFKAQLGDDTLISGKYVTAITK